MSSSNVYKKTARGQKSMNGNYHDKPPASAPPSNAKIRQSMNGNYHDKPMPSAPPLNAKPMPSAPIRSLTSIISQQGPPLWNFLNALAFLVIISAIMFGAVWGMSKVSEMAEVKKNWKKYRCDPTIMPFASLYGHDTAENFNYCMGNIFSIHSADITGPFTSVIGQFTGILSVLLKSVDSIRVGLATLGGGVNVIFQEFTDRISTFFFRMRLSAIRVKTLIGRMYATMFAVVYMGLSSITGMTSFTNTVLFSFLDTFCFPPETQITIDCKGEELVIPIAAVNIGDILLPTRSRVTAKFHFAAHGQPMVRLVNPTSDVTVSSNHYLMHDTKWIRASDHPDVVASPEPYTSSSLICLNTEDHKIPVNSYIFRDYDETDANDADEKTMQFIEGRINGKASPSIPYPFTEYCPSLERLTQIRLKDGSIQAIADIPLGTELSTGCKVVGKVQREIREFCVIDGNKMASATLVWNSSKGEWKRAGARSTIWAINQTPVVFISLFVTPSSLIELADGTIIRDSIEICSPDAELYYAEQLELLK